MPSKIQPDDNLLFLFRCLEASDYKSIDYRVVGAAVGLKAPAARMRFTRLKKHIEASLSISTLASVSTNGKTGNSTEAGPKNNAKRKISEKQKQPLSSKFGGDQIGNVEGELKIKTENAEIEVVTPSAPVKRQSRGKKIDVSAAFESDSSPTPGARVEHEVHSSDYEDSQAAGEEDDGIPGGFESEHEHLAKRRRLFPLKRKQSRPDFNRRLFPNNGPRSLPQSVLKEPISTSDAGSTSICAAQFISAYPNPPDSRYTNAATANLSFTDASAADIMPSIEYDASNDGSLEKLFDSVNANTGSLEEESEIQDNDSTKPANSAFLLQNTVPLQWPPNQSHQGALSSEEEACLSAGLAKPTATPLVEEEG